MNLDIGTKYEQSLDLDFRKKDGVFYTSKNIADYIVQNTLGIICSNKKIELKIDNKFADKNKLETYKNWLSNLKILDPACGSGIFLIAVFDFLISEYKLSVNSIDEKLILKNNIFGVDIDEKSVENTKQILIQKYNQFLDLSENIKCGNSLISDKKISEKAFHWETEFKEIMDNGGFDIVVGNPPYVYSRDGRIDNEEQKYFRKNYNFIQHRVNTYFLFVDKSYNILKEKGYFGFIIPNTWQTVNSFSELRKFLITKTSELNIINVFDKIFKDASVDTCLLSFKKDKPTKILLGELENAEIKIIGKFGYPRKVGQLNYQGNTFPSPIFIAFGNKNSTLERVEYLKFVQLYVGSRKFDKSIFIAPDFYINFKLAKNPIYFKLLNKIQDNSVEIEKVADVKTGIIAYLKNNGIPKQTVEDVKNRIYHSDKQEDIDYLKYFMGKDITRYKYRWSGQWIKYGKNLGRMRQADLFENERILIKQIPSPLPYCLNAVYVNEHIINDINSTIITNFRKNPLFLLSIINSKLTSFWFVIYFDKLQRKIFPQFKIHDLKKFPIPKANEKDEKKIIKLTNLILSLNNDLQNKSEKFIKRIKSNLKIEEISSKLHNFYDYNFNIFVSEVKKKKVKLSLKQQDDWEEYFDFHKKEIIDLDN